MQNLVKDFVRMVLIVVTSPLLALALYVLDTKVKNRSFSYWLNDMFIYSLCACAAYLTVTWLYRAYYYSSKEELKRKEKAKKILNKRK